MTCLSENPLPIFFSLSALYLGGLTAGSMWVIQRARVGLHGRYSLSTLVLLLGSREELRNVAGSWLSAFDERDRDLLIRTRRKMALLGGAVFAAFGAIWILIAGPC